MMWLSDEAEACLKQLEKPFCRLVVRIADFQNDWDRCDPIWRFCWQDRRRKWYAARVSYYNGVYYVSNFGESWYRDSWIWEVKPGEFCREYDNGAHDHQPWPIALPKDFVRWNRLPMPRSRERGYSPIVKERPEEL